MVIEGGRHVLPQEKEGMETANSVFPRPTETSMTVPRSVLCTVRRPEITGCSSCYNLMIPGALLPPVARPPNRVAMRMSWNPLKVSAMISCNAEIAIHPVVNPMTATMAGESKRYLPTRSPMKK